MRALGHIILGWLVGMLTGYLLNPMAGFFVAVIVGFFIGVATAVACLLRVKEPKPANTLVN